MTIGVTLKVLKELGLLNIVGIIFILNAPGIIFNMYQNNKFRQGVLKNFVDKDQYDRDVKGLYKTTLEPLTEDIGALRKAIDSLTSTLQEQMRTVVRHDEKLKRIDK